MNFPRNKRLISNTEKLILICIRLNSEKAHALIAEGVDWKFFRENTIRTGLCSVIYDSLKEISRKSRVPEYILTILKTTYQYTAAKANAQYRETLSILRMFQEKNIPAVPLKGVIMALCLYGDVAGRGTSADIDILVEEKNKSEAAALLEKAGYAFYDSGMTEPERFWQHSYTKRGSCPVDLHWTISPYILAHDDIVKKLWENAELCQRDGVSYYGLREDQLLLYLSIHLTGDAHLLRLRYICDIDALVRKDKGTLCWEKITGEAKRYGISGSLYTALLFSKKLLGTPLPDGVMKELERGVFKRLLIGSLTDERVIFSRNSRRRKFIDRFLKYLLFQILETNSLRSCLYILFPPKEKIGKRTYRRRFLSGISKFIYGIISKHRI
ncbi:MAG: nucleotidyltransferase family protein [Candidatus Omnitrophica bacterium]|nr:nucleotidyltransferase family protein [Candidatus Omnitrophota bacterium]